MKQVLFILFILFFKSNLLSQNFDNKKTDTLLVETYRTFYLKNTVKLIERQINTELLYDFNNQYPFYRIHKKQFGKNNILHLKFKRFPSAGFLYVFTGNNINVFKEVDELNLSEQKVSEKLFTINPLKENTEIIGIFYSNYKINDFQDLLKKLEFTYGDYTKRITQFIEHTLLLPNSKWNLINSRIGFSKIQNIPEESLLPIIILIN